MSIIRSKDVMDIIFRTLGIVDKEVMTHCEITGYLLYKILDSKECYTKRELLDYILVGLLHDIGLFRESPREDLGNAEIIDPVEHSLYGYLFIRFFTPLGDKADIVRDHHQHYNRFPALRMSADNKKVLEYLNLVDKLEHRRMGLLGPNYFKVNRDITFSGKAFQEFQALESKEHLLDKLKDGSYKEELDGFLRDHSLSERDMRKYLEMMIYIIDFRSEVTVIHTMSTVYFAEQLAKLSNFSRSEIRDIHYGAMLHDLGKIDIPLEILESSGGLSPEEMEIMKSHVEKTESILKGTIDDTIVQIAVRHHEKLDGSAYPRGLKQEHLTLAQQLVAVADILSAVYSKRSYKEAFEKETIKKILQSDADAGKINKEIVACLMDNYDMIIQNYEKEKEDIIGRYLKIKETYEELYQILKTCG